MNQAEWCGPFALHIITDKSYDECLNLVKNTSVGDEYVSGLWMGAMIQSLKAEGFTLKAMKADGQYTLSNLRYTTGIFLCEIHGHYVVIKNGKMFDNAHPCGAIPTKHRVLRAYEVTK